MSEDVLQLDQQLTTTKRAKIAKLDQDRILGPKGLPYIVKNHQKLNRVINRKHSKMSKIDLELQNMSSILQFYQLWCHTLFPKAKFKDCVQMVRGLPNRSPGLRIYRKQLIELELQKLRAEKGIINVDENTDIGVVSNDIGVDEGGSNDVGVDDVEGGSNEGDDDFGFMSNGLFVGDDEDLYETPRIPVPQLDPVDRSMETTFGETTLGEVTDSEPAAPSQQIPVPQLQDVDTTIEPPELASIIESGIDETMDAHNDQEHDEELEIMRELGM